MDPKLFDELNRIGREDIARNPPIESLTWPKTYAEIIDRLTGSPMQRGAAAGRRLYGIDGAWQKIADDFLLMVFDTPGDFDDHVKSTMAEYTIGFMTAWAEAAQ